jgi:hypothetical protein
VPSGVYSFTDTIPPGMVFNAASDGGTASGQVVTWTDRPSLLPGQSATVTVSATLIDTSLGSYRNWVQVTDDSAGTFSTPTEAVVDRDSTPANGEQGEDDDDPAVFEVVPVTPSGTTVPDPGSGTRGSLVATGASVVLATALGAGLAAGGAALVTSTRRRRRPTGRR